MSQEDEVPLVVTAVVTWFHPTSEALDALREAAAQCAHVVIVDNTPIDQLPVSGGGSAGLPAHVHLLRLGRNGGLAAALNIGLHHLPDDTQAVLLLDQDSRPPADLVEALSRHLRAGAGAVAPAPWDAREGRYLDPRSALRPEVSDVPVAITSGLLIAREVVEAVGPFREDFFVDAVDIDFCLRLRRGGWRLVLDRSVRLDHRLGNTRWHRVLGVGVRASHHPDWRLYSGARNGTRLVREHLLTAPGWAVTQVSLLAYWWLTVTVFEPPRPRRSRLFLHGVVDGWRGSASRLSIPPDERR